MSMTTELLVALWFTVLPAQQMTRPSPPLVSAPACADPGVFVKTIAVDATGTLRYLQDVRHRRFPDAVAVGTADVVLPPVVDATLETVEILHEGERHAQIAIRATCPVNARCRVPGLIARRVAFEVESIRWKAGAGWPEYRQASPRDDRSTVMLYPGALVHQLILAIGANGFT